MKRILSLVLALMLLLSVSAFADTDYTVWTPDWNPAEVETASYTYYEPNWPIANGDVTISIATAVNSSYYKAPEDTWFWNWAKLATGLNFDIRQITGEAKTEQLNLMFASNNLPDVMLGMSLTTGDIMRYGVQESQLLDITPYINEETMPYFTQWCEKYPMIKSVATTPDGAIYSVPFTTLQSDYYGSQETMDYNMEWLKEVYPDALPDEIPSSLDDYYAWVEAANKVLPRTLDEFNELLAAFKANHPDGYPLSGVEASDPFMAYIMHAFGYVGGEAYGYEPALRNGEVVIPAIDDTFFEYLKTLNEYYNAGYFTPDYYSADKLVVNAQLTDNKSGIHAGGVYGIMPEMKDYHKWDSLFPLASEFNENPQVRESSRYKIGGCVLSANCSNPEAALNFIDFFFSDLGIYYLWEGPIYGSPDTLDMVIGFYYADGAKRFPDVINGTYENSLAYVQGMGLGLSSAFGNRSHSVTDPENHTTMMETLQFVEGVAEEDINRVALAYDHGDNYARICSKERVLPYVVNAFPYIVYYDAETQETIDEITLLLNDYIKSSVAKFVTGATALTEENFKAFVAEADVYGASELLEIYKEAYQNYLATL